MLKGNSKSTIILLFYDLVIIQQKCLKLHIYNNAVVKRNFWTTITSNGSPSATVPLLCLSVCNVGVGLLWTNGWMDQDATT